MTSMTAPSDVRRAVGLAALSPAEEQVFRLLAIGLTQKEAAHRLGRSPHTVRWQTTAVYERFGVSGLSELLWTLGWVRLP